MTKFRHELHYDAAPTEVYAMLVDAAFREKVCAAIGSPQHMVSVDEEGGAVVVTVDQQQEVHKVPPPVAVLLGDSVQIVQVETWRSETTADLELTVPGKPGQLRGKIVLEPTDGGTTQKITGDLKVNVPLVGGKLEGVIEGLLKLALKAEQETGAAWLAGDG